MMKRCIMIFPKFENEKVINEIRNSYDPLAKNVKPHITLVFPFESDITTNELKEHILTVVSDITPFEILLKGITPNNSSGKYLFLNIQKGFDEITNLHKKLYSGILHIFYPQWLNGTVYLPHMTVGHFNDNTVFEKAINETKHIDCSFKTTVSEISVEIIDKNEDSIIELNIPLNKFN